MENNDFNHRGEKRRREIRVWTDGCFDHRAPTQSVWVAVYSKCTRFTVCLTYSRHISLTLYENQS